LVFLPTALFIVFLAIFLVAAAFLSGAGFLTMTLAAVFRGAGLVFAVLVLADLVFADSIKACQLEVTLWPGRTAAPGRKRKPERLSMR
jgi:hypothetical protein